MTPADRLELRLREALRNRASDMAVPPGLPDRLVERALSTPVAAAGLDRPTRRWTPVLVAAAVVVLVAVALVTARHEVLSERRPARPERAVVPWDATGQQRVTTRQWPATSVGLMGAPKGTKPCASQDLRLVSAQSAPDRLGSGWVTTDFSLQSTSAADCSVSAYGIPAVIVDEHGRVIPDDARFHGGGPRRPDAWLVRPGQMVAASVGWAHVRGQGPEPDALVVLPSSEAAPEPDARLSVSLKDVHAPPAPVNPSNLGPWRTGRGSGNVTSIADAGSLASLTASITGPISVAQGQTVTLTVNLANHTDRSVQLMPCPTVNLTLTVVPAKVGITTGTRGPLNCAAAPRSIPPGQSVRFAAQLTARNVPNGDGAVVWTLTAGGQTVVSTWAAPTVEP
jgi:hypothetical protein